MFSFLQPPQKRVPSKRHALDFQQRPSRPWAGTAGIPGRGSGRASARTSRKAPRASRSRGRPARRTAGSWRAPRRGEKKNKIPERRSQFFMDDVDAMGHAGSNPGNWCSWFFSLGGSGTGTFYLPHGGLWELSHPNSAPCFRVGFVVKPTGKPRRKPFWRSNLLPNWCSRGFPFRYQSKAVHHLEKPPSDVDRTDQIRVSGNFSLHFLWNRNKLWPAKCARGNFRKTRGKKKKRGPLTPKPILPVSPRIVGPGQIGEHAVEEPPVLLGLLQHALRPPARVRLRAPRVRLRVRGWAPGSVLKAHRLVVDTGLCLTASCCSGKERWNDPKRNPPSGQLVVSFHLQVHSLIPCALFRKLSGGRSRSRRNEPEAPKSTWLWLKIKQGGGGGGLRPCFHLPGFHFGTGVLSHSHMGKHHQNLANGSVCLKFPQ